MLKPVLRRIQQLVRADKAIVVGVLMQGVVALAAAMKFHVGAEAVAVISTVINLGVMYFLHQNFKAKLAAKKDA